MKKRPPKAIFACLTKAVKIMRSWQAAFIACSCRQRSNRRGWQHQAVETIAVMITKSRKKQLQNLLLDTLE